MRGAPRRMAGGVVFSAALVASLLGSGQAVQAAVRGGNDAHRFITVMTRNMDGGTDFGYIVGPNALPFATGAALTYQEVLAIDIPQRASAIADEIAATQPDLVSGNGARHPRLGVRGRHGPRPHGALHRHAPGEVLVCHPGGPGARSWSPAQPTRPSPSSWPRT